jgi:NADH dehydrogenase/NADH:ubiquinone oxidoreductase subunit G
MHVIIDGLSCSAEAGEFVKAVADRNGIAIPSLCHHLALPGLAACRLCVVEAKKAGGKPPQVVSSCVYPVSVGLEVTTNSERIQRLRKTILKLLISRAPMAEGRLIQYCQEYGVSEGFAAFNSEACEEGEKCILCGLCVKACDELGNSAIATVMRGVDKQVQPAFDEASPDCIGCASCAKVCPTKSIVWSEDREHRVIWDKTFKLERCPSCGRPFATTEELEWLSARNIGSDINVSICPSCRSREAVQKLAL